MDSSQKPFFAQKLFLDGLRQHGAGALKHAEDSYRQALIFDPAHADSLHMLGCLAHNAGQRDEAIALIRRAIETRKNVALYHLSLGHALVAKGQLSDAVPHYEQALSLKPAPQAEAEAHHALGAVLRALGQGDAAIHHDQQVVRLKPGDAQAHNALGSALMSQSRFQEAAESYRQALTRQPDLAEAHNNLGTIHHRQGRFPEAIAHYQQALACDPGLVETHDNLATLFRDQGLLAEAAAGYQRALALRPDFAEAHHNLSIVRKEQGRLSEALEEARQAVALKPESARLHSHLLMGLNYSPDLDEADLTAACRDWGRRHGPISARRVRQGSPVSPPPLRVGYVSSHFRRHPVGWFLASVWPAHAAGEVAIHAYSGSVLEDPMTRHLRSQTVVWRETAAMSDAELAQRIEDDGIHVLVDLDGHTEGNRLPLFAHRPAPVQISWLGHGYSTGLAAMDAILMDDITAPTGCESLFTESVMRLPGGRLCYAPPDYAPPVTPPPCLSRDWVTFGSFNNLAKLSPTVLELWGRILAAVPRARLQLRWKSLADETERHRLRAVFAAMGGDPEQLDLYGAVPHPALLAAYGDIDIALDSFPFGGGLTSCEALWMGVPVVTWPGQRPMSRQTLGFLAALGETETLAAKSADGMVALAATLAATPARLTVLRTNLRPQMAASPLCNGPRMARALEAAYRNAYRVFRRLHPGIEQESSDAQSVLAGTQDKAAHQSGPLSTPDFFTKNLL